MIISNPLVSVLLPVYNSEEYIEASVRSMLDQTYKHLELIIIDDASLDNSYKIVSTLSEKDKRIQLFKNVKNLGITQTLNKGLRLCNGKYIARMDADDISLPTRIEKQVEYMEKNPECVVCGTWIKTFGLQHRIRRFPKTNVAFCQQFPFRLPLPHPATMIRRDTLVRHNVCYKNIPAAEDYQFFNELLSYGKMGNIPEILLYYRKSKQQITCVNHKRSAQSSRGVRRSYIERFFRETNIPWVLPQKITLATIRHLKRLNKHNDKTIKTIVHVCFLSLHKYSLTSFLYFLFSFDYLGYPYTIKEFIRVIYKHVKPSRWVSWL